MLKKLDFYFDVGSPTAYLAYQKLLQMKSIYDFKLIYIPVLLGGIFKLTGNQSPALIPAKGRYMELFDLPRFAKLYNTSFKSNPHFPVNTLSLMRGAIAAQEMTCLNEYINCVFKALWVKQLDMGDPKIVADELEKNGIDYNAIIQLAQSKPIKTKLIDNTQQSVDRGVFGAPTFFIGEEMYFGQDRLQMIETLLIEDREQTESLVK
ncbi:MAG: disulfide bond formation protein DsbA [Cellvibrionales bacterium TMED49]|nr:disulfide bond formation protein DsbA [Porticoccaceae bacterium]OUU38699.1 MAG: disulfide bond formation protein DsbA [Cellvibrionales bacterium TMED49]